MTALTSSQGLSNSINRGSAAVRVAVRSMFQKPQADKLIAVSCGPCLGLRSLNTGTSHGRSFESTHAQTHAVAGGVVYLERTSY